jgi:hypothetical protein
MSAEADYTDVPLDKLSDFYEAIASTAGTETGVQITGGEPTVRADLPEIIRRGRDRGFWGVEVNTNGLVISQDNGYLESLVEAGLTGIYLQFDGVTAEPYKKIRGADLLATKLRAVERCREVGVQVVLAMTIVSGINSDEVGAVIAYALENVDIVAGVALQPAFTSGRFDAKRVEPLSMGDAIALLDAQTNGLIRSEDIWPLGCSHPLCDTGTLLVPGELTGDVSVSEGAEAEGARGTVLTEDEGVRGTYNVTPSGVKLYVPLTPSSSVNTVPLLPEEPKALEPSPVNTYIPVTRDLTREEYLELYNPDSPQGSVFHDIVHKKGLSPERGLSVIIMNYMDALTMDLERIEECSMFVTMPDGRLLPFCSYQLTNCTGQRLYPPWGMPTDEFGAVKWT